MVFRKYLGKCLLPPIIQFLEFGVFAFWIKQKVVVDFDHGWACDFTGDVMRHRYVPDYQ